MQAERRSSSMVQMPHRPPRGFNNWDKIARVFRNAEGETIEEGGLGGDSACLPKRVASVVGVGRAARKCAERGCETRSGARTRMHAAREGGRSTDWQTKTRACASERREHWIMLKKTKGFQPLYRASWVAGFSPFPLCLSSPLLWYASTDGPPSPEVTNPPGFRVPCFCAFKTIPFAARSFTEPPGFMNSAFPRIVHLVSSDALRR